MIESFSCSNFRSIKHEVTLSFEPTSEEVKKTSQVYEVAPGVHLLRMAIIHGANASGKTNILRAFEFLSDFWLKEPRSKNAGIDIIPFKFQEDTNQNSSFELVCYVKGQKMVYKLELNSTEVVRESLDYYASTQPSNAFTRTTENGISTITFPSKMKVSAAAKEVLTLRCLPNSSVITAYSQINAQIAILDDFEKWQFSTLFPVMHSHIYMGNWAKSELNKHPKSKTFILDFLREADFNIVDFTNTETPINYPESAQGFIGQFNKYISRELGRNEKERQEYQKNYELINKSVFDLELTHRVIQEDDTSSDYQLEEELQSAGTHRLLMLAVLLYQIFETKGIAYFDEIESSLHPYLLYYFIRRFLENESPTQLIVTTHYDPLLTQTSWIDKDLFWFTEKQKDGSTDLYSLSEFKGLKRINIQKAYLSGNFGALPEIDY